MVSDPPKLRNENIQTTIYIVIFIYKSIPNISVAYISS